MPVPYYGDYPEDHANVRIPFNTFDSNDPSASVTITNLVAGDIKIHKEGGVSEKASANGVAVAINFDGITGNHIVSLDTSDDTGAAGFWVTGSEYQVRMEGTTVDGATINAWIGSFSIERAGGTIALLKLIQAATITNAQGTDVASDVAAMIDGNNRVDVGSWLGTAVTLSTGNQPDVNVDRIDDVAVSTVATDGKLHVRNDAGGTIQAAADAALVANNLDHLCKVVTAAADMTTEVVDNTILSRVLSNGDTSAFVPSTDGLQPLRDHIGNGTNLTEAGGDGDHLTESGGTGDQLTAINLPNQTMDIIGTITGNLIGDVTGNVDGTVAGVTPEAAGVAPTAAEVVNEWESQSQADPTGFHVNVLEVGGTAQTANDNGADINDILSDTGTTLPAEHAALSVEHAALPTAIENRQEMDSNSTELAKIGTIPALDGAGQTIGAAIAKIADDNGGATYDAGTDSLNKIRDDRTLPAADYVVVGDTIAGVTLVATTTAVTNDVGITQAGADKAWGTAARVLTANTNFNDPTTAQIKTAMEADGGDLSSLMEALVNKLLITEANGNAEIFNDAGVSQGTVAAAITSVAGVTQRKRMLI